jgi:hypothetical protein
MYSLALLVADLQMTKGRLLGVFDMLELRGSTTVLFHGSDGDWTRQRGMGKPEAAPR